MGLDLSYIGGGSSSSLVPDFSGFDLDEPKPTYAIAKKPVPTRASVSADVKPTPPTRGFPERIQPDKYFGNVFGEDYGPADGTGSALANLAMIPGRVQETPISTVNTLSKGGFSDLLGAVPFIGNALSITKAIDDEAAKLPNPSALTGLALRRSMTDRKGVVDQGLDFLSKTPVIGDIGRGVNSLLEESGKVGPALVNAGDLNRLRSLASKPDDMLLRDADPNFFLSALGGNPLNAIARSLDLNLTVGDFRREMVKRGFTPDDLGELERGEKADYDFGDRPSSSNPLLALAQSAALDPTNLAFIAGPARLAKAGIGLLPKMEKIGLASAKVPDKVASAIGIANGNPAAVTLQGVGHFIANSLAHPERLVKPYTKFAVGESAGLAALDATTDWLDDNVPDDFAGMPLIRDLHELSSSIINDHPLSEGAAWNFFAAFHFPVRDFAAGAGVKVNQAIRSIKGGDGAVAEFKRVFGPQFLERVGGEPGAATMINFIDEQIAKKHVGRTVSEKFGTIDDRAQREALFHELVHDVRDRMRDEGKISNADRVKTFKEWFGEQSGFEETGVRQQWDPERALDHWVNTWIPIQRQYGTTLSARGQAVIGLEPRLTKENIDDIRAVVKAQSPGGVVPLPVIRKLFDKYPQLVSNTPELAKFGVPDAKAPTYEYFSNELSRAKRESPTSAELTAELGRAEVDAPASPRMPEQQTGHREITGDFERDVLGVDLSVEGPPGPRGFRATDPYPEGNMPPRSEARIPTPDEVAPIRAARDEAQGADAGYNQRLDQEAQQLTDEVDWKGETMPRSAAEQLDNLERSLKQEYPGYTFKVPPKIATIMRQAEIEAPQIATQVMRLNSLYEGLRYFGPFSAVVRGFDALLSPVVGREMRDNARQALLNYALPRGATPGEIDLITRRVAEHANLEKTRFGTIESGVPWEHMKPSVIDGIAEQVLSPEAFAQIKKDFGGFTRMTDRAFNRAIQKAHAAKGPVSGRLGRAVETAYGGYQATVGRPARYLKVYYPLFRFSLSPRYWMMNVLEADVLGGVKYGTGLADDRAGIASIVHGKGMLPSEKLIAEASEVARLDTAQPFVIGRRMAGYVSKAFDKTRVESAQALIDDLPRNAPEFKFMEEHFGPNHGTWSQQLDQMLYDFDTKGVKGAVDDQAAAIFTPDELKQMAPFMQRLYEVNDKSFKAITNMFEGNNSRSNMERVLNSYWLYWPLTYQLKAGKWLFDVLTERAFGRKTNFAGAYTLANLEKTHRELAATSEDYRQMFKDYPTLWFVAGMMFPITPYDLGVSLNRGVRYAGGALGWWGSYAESQDPVAAATKMMELGPLYDLTLLTRGIPEARKALGLDSKPAPNAEQPKATAKPKPKPYPAQYTPPTFGTPVPIGG